MSTTYFSGINTTVALKRADAWALHDLLEELNIYSGCRTTLESYLEESAESFVAFNATVETVQDLSECVKKNAPSYPGIEKALKHALDFPDYD